jgi:hypothetical protein
MHLYTNHRIKCTNTKIKYLGDEGIPGRGSISQMRPICGHPVVNNSDFSVNVSESQEYVFEGLQTLLSLFY